MREVLTVARIIHAVPGLALTCETPKIPLLEVISVLLVLMYIIWDEANYQKPVPKYCFNRFSRWNLILSPFSPALNP